MRISDLAALLLLLAAGCGREQAATPAAEPVRAAATPATAEPAVEPTAPATSPTTMPVRFASNGRDASCDGNSGLASCSVCVA